MSLPLPKKSVLKKFEVEIEDQKIISKIYSKEKAEEKQSDAIAQGNTGIMATLSDSNTTDVFLGNVPPLKKVIVRLFILQLNSTYDKSMKFNYSFYNLPSFCGVNLFNIKGSSKEFGLGGNNSLFNVPSFDFNNNSNNFSNIIKYKSSFTANLTTSNNISRLISDEVYHQKLKFNFIKANHCEISLDGEYIEPEKELNIYFRTKNSSHFKVYEEYDDKLKIYSYNINFLVDKYDNIKEKENLNTTSTSSPSSVDLNSSLKYKSIYDKGILNDYPGAFTFVLDQSGSMSGSSMNIAKESLILFIQSLPLNSKFDIIGFGSNYVEYFSTIQDYNEKTTKEAIEKIKSLSANLGGTEIYSPLKKIYVNEYKTKTKKFGDDLPKYIFLITDGCVSDSQECCKLVKEFSDDFKIISIGIGSGVDNNFISSIASSGKGNSYLVPNVSNLQEVVINALNFSLEPFLSKIKIKLPDEIKTNNEEEEKILEYPSLGKDNTIKFKQDEIFSYSFISNTPLKKNSQIEFSYYDYSNEKTLNHTIEINDITLRRISLNENNSLNKLIVGLKLNEVEDESINEDEAEKLALRFQVLSKHTALFAELENFEVVKSTEKIQVDGRGEKSSNNSFNPSSSKSKLALLNDRNYNNNNFNNLFGGNNNNLNSSSWGGGNNSIFGNNNSDRSIFFSDSNSGAGFNFGNNSNYKSGGGGLFGSSSGNTNTGSSLFGGGNALRSCNYNNMNNNYNNQNSIFGAQSSNNNNYSGGFGNLTYNNNFNSNFRENSNYSNKNMQQSNTTKSKIISENDLFDINATSPPKTSTYSFDDFSSLGQNNNQTFNNLQSNQINDNFCYDSISFSNNNYSQLELSQNKNLNNKCSFSSAPTTNYNTTTNNTFNNCNLVVKTDLNSIISNQCYLGLWNKDYSAMLCQKLDEENLITKASFSSSAFSTNYISFSQLYSKIVLEMTNFSLNSNLNYSEENIHTYSTTVFILTVINLLYSTKKEEYKLIENKSKKYLSKRKVDYNEIVSKL